MQRKFRFDEQDEIIKENVNRNLIQLPVRTANFREIEDKNPYHNILFDLEDELFQKDWSLFSLKLAKKRINSCEDPKDPQELKKLTKIPLLAKEISKCPADLTKSVLEDIHTEFTSQEVTEREKRMKIASKVQQETQIFFQASLDQQLFLEKAQDLMKISNKVFKNSVLEQRFSEITEERKFYKTLDLLEIDYNPDILWEKIQHTINGCNEEKPVFTLPLFAKETYQIAYTWLLEDLILTKVFAKVIK